MDEAQSVQTDPVNADPTVDRDQLTTTEAPKRRKRSIIKIQKKLKGRLINQVVFWMKI